MHTSATPSDISITRDEAAEQGHANVVGLLLESKADVHHTFDAVPEWCIVFLLER